MARCTAIMRIIGPGARAVAALLAAAVVFVCGSLSHAGETSGPVPPDRRDAKAAGLVSKMEAELAAKFSKVTVKNADFFPPAKKKEPAVRRGGKKKLVARLGLRKAQINVLAGEVREVFGDEVRRLYEFVEVFDAREKQAVERELAKKLEKIEGLPPRKKNEERGNVFEEHRIKLERIRKTIVGTWSATAPIKWSELEKRLKALYSQLVDVLELLNRLGQKEKVPGFEEWSELELVKERMKKPAWRRRRDTMDRDEPGEKPGSGRPPGRRGFPPRGRRRGR